MKLIGLSGPAGVGKDSVADYLVQTYNFTKFSFSDALYDEVASSFRIDKDVLYARGTKEQPMEALQYFYCDDAKFQKIMFDNLQRAGHRYPMDAWCSPRQITQWWGTEYRRKQNPEYWIEKAAVFVKAFLERAVETPEMNRGGLVNSSVRFPNEAAFIKYWNGEVWHIQRKGYEMDAHAAAHEAERGLKPAPTDMVLVNNGTIEQLNTGASLLLQSKPGTELVCARRSISEVTCVHCGWVHMAYTRVEAEREVTTFNEWFAKQPDATKANYGGKPSKVEDYEGCDRCGKKSFRAFQKGDCPDGCTIGPVIVEKLEQ